MNYNILAKLSLKILISISLLTISLTSFAQDAKIDSLKQLLAETDDDSSRAEILIKLGSLVNGYAPEQSIEYSHEALDLYSKQNNIGGKARTLNKIGYNYWQLGKFLKAIDYYEEALTIFEELCDTTWIARVANNLGAIHWGLSNYNIALDLYQKALKIRRQENDSRGISLIMNNIGMIYQEWKLFDKALQYHEEALSIAKEINNLEARAYSYNNLGRCYESKKEYKKALKYYQLSYDDYLKDNQIGGATSLCLRNIGNIYYKLDQYDKAITYYQKSLQQAEGVNNQFRVAIAEYCLGRTYAKVNQLGAARKYIDKSLEKANKNGYNDLIRDNRYILSEIEEEHGNLHKALEYFKTASAMNDSIFNTEKRAKFTELQIKYNLEKKNQENAILRKNNEIQRLKIKRQQIVRNSFIVGGIFILVILGLIFNRSIILKKSNVALEEQNANIRKINNDKEKLIKELQQEITERKKVEEKLKESEERIDLALKGTGVGMWDWVVQTGEITYNEKWAEIIGYTLEELSPMSIDTWIKLTHPDDLKKRDELLEKHFAEKTEHYECESRMKHKNGNWVWVLDRGKVFKWDKDGKPIRMTGTHMDITERKMVEKEREEIIEKIKGKLDEKETPEGFISICAGCHKIMDEKKQWRLPADYLSEITNLVFSHSMCPDCMKKWYPDYYEGNHSNKKIM